MISVELDPRRFNRWLTAQAQKQVPYAAARALTQLAKDSQSDVRDGMQRSLTIRRPWALKGIHVSAAQKRDGLNGMKAEVGSRDWFMKDQLADGSSVRKAPGGKKQFLPKGARRGGKSAMVPKGLRPAAVTKLAKASNGGDGKYFFKQGTGGRSMVFQNLRGNRLKLIYTVGDKQTVKPKLHLNSVVRATVMRNGPREFVRQMQAAIRSAR